MNGYKKRINHLMNFQKNASATKIAAAFGLLLFSACEDEQDTVEKTATEVSEGNLIDEPCTDDFDCEAEYGECTDIGDGKDRCQAIRFVDKNCGHNAACLFPTDSDNDYGYCFRTCDTADDCPEADWECAELVSGSSQGYCFPLL